MGISILIGRQIGSDISMCCLFCTTTDTAFGPVFMDIKDKTADEVAIDFLYWHNAKYGDPRSAIGKELQERYAEFRNEKGLIE
jgi:hypothetical protein